MSATTTTCWRPAQAPSLDVQSWRNLDHDFPLDLLSSHLIVVLASQAKLSSLGPRNIVPAASGQTGMSARKRHDPEQAAALSSSSYLKKDPTCLRVNGGHRAAVIKGPEQLARSSAGALWSSVGGKIITGNRLRHRKLESADRLGRPGEAIVAALFIIVVMAHLCFVSPSAGHRACRSADQPASSWLPGVLIWQLEPFSSSPSRPTVASFWEKIMT